MKNFKKFSIEKKIKAIKNREKRKQQTRKKYLQFTCRQKVNIPNVYTQNDNQKIKKKPIRILQVRKLPPEEEIQMAAKDLERCFTSLRRQMLIEIKIMYFASDL